MNTLNAIDCFVSVQNQAETNQIIRELKKCRIVRSIYLLSPEKIDYKDAQVILCNNPFSTASIKAIASRSNSKWVMIALQTSGMKTGQFSLERMLQVAESTGASMVYTDYIEIKKGIQTPHPVIDYQLGSLRDDFNFGPVQLFKKEVLTEFDEDDYTSAGYYSLRLHASRIGELVRIPEFLFTLEEQDTRKSGEKQFDYVSQNARERQIEMEKVCTGHLEKIGGLLKPPFREINVSEVNFPVEASVIIPVRHRAKTIQDAVESVLAQNTLFDYPQFSGPYYVLLLINGVLHKDKERRETANFTNGYEF